MNRSAPSAPARTTLRAGSRRLGDRRTNWRSGIIPTSISAPERSKVAEYHFVRRAFEDHGRRGEFAEHAFGRNRLANARRPSRRRCRGRRCHLRRANGGWRGARGALDRRRAEDFYPARISDPSEECSRATRRTRSFERRLRKRSRKLNHFDEYALIVNDDHRFEPTRCLRAIYLDRRFGISPTAPMSVSAGEIAHSSTATAARPPRPARGSRRGRRSAALKL